MTEQLRNVQVETLRNYDGHDNVKKAASVMSKTTTLHLQVPG